MKKLRPRRGEAFGDSGEPVGARERKSEMNNALGAELNSFERIREGVLRDNLY